jgi:hypothetical protein
MNATKLINLLTLGETGSMGGKNNLQTFGHKALYTDTCIETAFNEPNLYRAFVFQFQIPCSLLVMSLPIIDLNQRFCITFYNMLIIYGKEL